MKGRPRQRGFSFVELLVTIVLAGIFFAAMVPLFVQAAQTSAGDNARTVALGIAQDKMERIRSLPYDDVEKAKLETDAARGLGKDASVGGKVFLLDYAVDYIWAPDQPYHEAGLELYKMVTVKAYWEGNPRPVKNVILRTAIYRQHTGPDMLSLLVTPRSQDGVTKGMIVPEADNFVYVSAYVSTAASIKEVDFKAESGSHSYGATVTQTAGGSVYVWKWDATDAPDGFYKITAYAVSTAGEQGNTWRVVEQLETGKPPAPASLIAEPGDLSVTLDWQTPAAGDIAYYEIWRSETPLRENATLLATNLEAVHYPDTAVANDTIEEPHHYYYWVYSIDLVGNTSDAATADAKPSWSAGDHAAPTVPSLTATWQSTTITLSWLASQDSSGVAYYEIVRSTDGVNYGPLAQPGPLSVSYVDSVGTDSPQYWYEIRAVDASVNVNRSAFSAPVGPLQTPITKTTLTVTNDRIGANKPCTVTVRDVVSRLYYDQNGVASNSAPTVTIESKGGSAQWHNLPIDKTFTVAATYSSGRPLSSSQQAPPWMVSFR